MGNELIRYLDSQLAPYAVKHAYALDKGARQHREESIDKDSRTPFQHDRDRIIHSRAFRRLRGKTQVFTATGGDHLRTRLSHSLEVAQMARSVARVFRLNEDLTEAIALGHDLGHAPFGHSGERMLHEILRGKHKGIWRQDAGGFKHNVNSLKIVDAFERYHPQWPGLNLTRWTREGILKHTDLTVAHEQRRVWDEVLDDSGLHLDHRVCTFLEGQIVAACDEVAQVTHDLEDAFRVGILTVKDERLLDIELYTRAFEGAKRERAYDDENLRVRLVRHLIRWLISSLIRETAPRVATIGEVSPVDVPISESIVGFDPATQKQVHLLTGVLRDAVYRSYEVSRMDIKGSLYVKELFRAYLEEPARLGDYVYRKYNDAAALLAKRLGQELPKRLARRDLGERVEDLKKDRVFARTTADHIAGMTDNFVIQEYRQLFLPEA